MVFGKAVQPQGRIGPEGPIQPEKPQRGGKVIATSSVMPCKIGSEERLSCKTLLCLTLHFV